MKVQPFTPAQMRQIPVREWPKLSFIGDGVLQIILETNRRGARRPNEYSVTPIFMVRGLAAFELANFEAFGADDDFATSQPGRVFWPPKSRQPINGPRDWNGMIHNSMSTYDNDAPKFIPDWVLGRTENDKSWHVSETLDCDTIPNKNKIADFFADAVHAFQTPQETWEALKFDGFIDRNCTPRSSTHHAFIAAQCKIPAKEFYESMKLGFQQLYVREKAASLYTHPTPKVIKEKVSFKKFKTFYDFTIRFCQDHDLVV